MPLTRPSLFVLGVLALFLAVLQAPPASTQEAVAERGLVDDIVTAAQLPAAILAQLPATAAEAGFAYAPRLVEVRVSNAEERSALVNSGLDVTEHAGDNFLEVVLYDATQEQVINDLGLDYHVETPDLIAQERDRILADAAYFQQTDESPLPSGRTTYRVLADFGTEIDQMAADNPDLVKRISVGESIEGRDLTGVEIGVGVNEPEDGRPVFLMFGNHHAREWPSAEAPMEFTHDLVDDFNAGDARAVDLLTRTRVIIVPVSNPDGYEISRTQGDLIDLNGLDEGGTVSLLATPGGAYKRKNCRLVDGQTQPPGPCALAFSPGGFGLGVDLNRNYGALWGGPGAAGFMPDANEVAVGPADPTYHGPAPFSEPETQAIRTLISTRQVTTLISNHTYSNLLLRPVGVNPSTMHPDGFPVGFAPDECFTQEDGLDNGMQALGERMTAQTGYSNQFGWELYDTTGTTEDYSYNATGGYGYTFEIGPNQFHPPYEEYIAEYTGSADAAQAVTLDNMSDLTTAVGRSCGDNVAAETVGGGLREAYWLALENAADTSTHSVLEGTAPEGAEIGVTRTGTFPLWDGTPFEDTVTTTMTVEESGAFSYHVNPSTRPFVDSRAYLPEGEVVEPEVTVLSEEQRTGNTAGPAVGSEDVPIEVPEGADALIVHVTADAPNDYDIQLFDPQLVEVDSSANQDTDETVEAISPSGIQAGEWVVRINNYAAAGDWTMDITIGTVPEVDGSEDELLFTPRTEELWTVTCAIDGEVVATGDVAVARGESADLGDFCEAGVGTTVTRLSGDSRFTTALDVSQDRFPEDDSAGAVVLARGDEPSGFADALAGGPLAVETNAPLLITNPDGLLDIVAEEIDRVLPDGATVYLLGGEAALAPSIEEDLDAAGYETVRIAGVGRHETAVEIADRLGNPDLVLVATGGTFPDALAASAAAGANDGAVLLTGSGEPHPATTAYLDEHDPSEALAVGGPAAAAYPDLESVAGPDRHATSVAVAERLFDQPTVAGVARSDAFPDALSGGAHIGALGGPMLLSQTDGLDQGVEAYLCGLDADEDIYLYGGTSALAANVMTAIQSAVGPTGCTS